MRTKPVLWSDGMLMLPHHFQAADAFVEELISQSHNWQLPYSYGLRVLEFSHDALSSFEARIPRLQARLKSGVLISVPENTHLNSVDLHGAFEDSSDVFLHLVLPELVIGDRNVGTFENSNGERYLVSASDWDDVKFGDQPRNIDTLSYNAQILATPSAESPAGYESIPLAKLTRNVAENSAPELDANFIPPLLCCDCWPALKEGILVAVCARLKSYIVTQADYLRLHGGWNEAAQGQMRRAIMMLNAVNTVYPKLFQLAHGRGIHPQDAYFALCSLMGHLSILRDDWKAPELPVYDHNALGQIFRTVKQLIDETLSAEGADVKVKRFPINSVGEWMEVTLDPVWLQGNYEFYIGVRSDLAPERLEQLFSSRWLDWKLGSSRTISQIYAHAEAGLNLRRVTGVHEVLPVMSNLTYFGVIPQGGYWDQVVDSRNLAMKVNERYIRELSTGKNTITVVDPKNTPRDLTLELFVVEQ